MLLARAYSALVSVRARRPSAPPDRIAPLAQRRGSGAAVPKCTGGARCKRQMPADMRGLPLASAQEPVGGRSPVLTGRRCQALRPPAAREGGLGKRSNGAAQSGPPFVILRSVWSPHLEEITVAAWRLQCHMCCAEIV